MIQVDIHEAATQLSQLIDRALHGEEVILARRGQALVRLAPVESQSRLRPTGLHRQPLSETSAQELLRPLSQAELAGWDGD